jgi:hypothetical protein
MSTATATAKATAIRKPRLSPTARRLDVARLAKLDRVEAKAERVVTLWQRADGDILRVRDEVRELLRLLLTDL